jgi:hypothetical protein
MTSIINRELWLITKPTIQMHDMADRHQIIASILPVKKFFEFRDRNNRSLYLKIVFYAFDFGWEKPFLCQEIKSWEELMASAVNVRVSNTVNAFDDPITGKAIFENEDTEHGYMELLGEYLTDDEDKVTEGEIVVYQKRIEQVAQRYVAQQNVDDNTREELLKQAIEDLTEITMAHVTVHWMLHTFLSPGWSDPSQLNGGASPYEYYSYENIYFHETAAQLLTFLVLKDNERMLSLFNWLGKYQSEQYRAYLKIYENGVNTVKDFLSLLEVFNEAGSQCYSRLLNLSKWKFNLNCDNKLIHTMGKGGFNAGEMSDSEMFNIMTHRFEMLLHVVDSGKKEVDWEAIGRKILNQYSNLPTAQTDYLLQLLGLKRLNLI